MDDLPNYPNDTGYGGEISDNFIEVGATEWRYGSDMIADYSNYGKNSVDIFAPGSKIHSTYPENTYKSIDGTSMAAPGVAGIAALIRSLYPHLTAPEVKRIILNSGLALGTKVVVPGNSGAVEPFGGLSKSGRLANAYNALILAGQYFE